MDRPFWPLHGAEPDQRLISVADAIFHLGSEYRRHHEGHEISRRPRRPWLRPPRESGMLHDDVLRWRSVAVEGLERSDGHNRPDQPRRVAAGGLHRRPYLLEQRAAGDARADPVVV